MRGGMVDQTEMGEVPYTPTEFIRSASQRKNHHSPQSSAAPQTSRRPPSSIYSRSTTFQDDQQTMVQDSNAGQHHRRREHQNNREKVPSRLESWMSPVMRRATQNFSTVTSISALLKAIPSSRDNTPGHTRIEAESDQTDEERALATHKRRCSFIRVGFGILALIAVIILILCICIAVGVFNHDKASSPENDEATETSAVASAGIGGTITAQVPTVVTSSMPPSRTDSGKGKPGSSTLDSTSPSSTKNPLLGLIPDLEFA